ncbi:MAG: ABC transporter ATP-binding protein [Clostridiales Family XIII bacterium]|nr:ABC transporter ATP-binding protein [Clostridiales Family XIII bacterium]
MDLNQKKNDVPVLKFQRVAKRFPNAQINAVNDVSFSVNRGDFITILGRSGSGKTTLLKMVNRIHEMTAGDIFFEGENIKNLNLQDYRRRVGYVIQQIGLFPHMTVAENIATVPSVLKWEKTRIDTRVDVLLTLVGLDPAEYRNRYPGKLSGGQQQRVGLARAMAAEPDLMLMDEPFGALDAITRQTLQDELVKIQQKLNTTILFVTHDIQEAFKLGDRVIIMDEGEIQQYATPINILFEPANDFVSQLVSAEDAVQKLKVLRAGAIASDLGFQTKSGDLRIDKDVYLDKVLARFFETRAEYFVVTGKDGQPIGQISWEQFKNFAQFRKDGVDSKKEAV